MAKSLLVFLLILYVFESSVATKFTSISHVDECSMLFQFKNNMSLDNSASFDPRAYTKVASWSNGTRDCCLWDGVECSSGHVTGLDLSSSFLSGPIHSNSSLFDLIYLRSLNLADNDFHFSQIPSGIESLSQLANLNLSYSFFSGQVPREMSNLSRLVSLDLTGNRLKLQRLGFKNLVRNSIETLKELLLSEVKIDSEVPVILTNSSSLKSLVLRDCGLSGDFPLDIYNLPTLQVLDVQGNKNLSGYFTEFIGKSQLKQLIVADTNFQGVVPASIGNLTHLNCLNLSDNFLNGPFPRSVSNLTQLTVLDLGGNFFSGRIPPLESLSKLTYLKLYNFNGSNQCELLGMFPNLSYLDLGFNNLSCEIPSSIGNHSKLRELYLSANGMIGQIPSSIMNLTQLTVLSLDNNKFTGHLPSLESLQDLAYLSLSESNFDRWKLPDWFGKLNKIAHLDLSDVNLYGKIPPSIFFNTSQLQKLYLSNNNLTGRVPSSLTNLQNLDTLFLSDNNIGGTVEVDTFLSLKKLKYLYIGWNKITLSVINNHTNHKSLPQFVVLRLESCNLKVFPDFIRFQHQLQHLYLDNNTIDGLVPRWMWNISSETLSELSLTQNHLKGFEQHSPVAPWVSLQILDLSHNMLHGSIPLPPPGTKNFFVSHNQLTGEIAPSLCNVQSLVLLDLSFNNITGSIPPCLGKLNSSVLNLRSNNLQGTIPNTFTNECKLRMISLSENKLKGGIPRSLENCDSLELLDLGNNYIEDIFPFWLGAISGLQVLILRSNKFHGVVRASSKTDDYSFTKLRIIDLSYNSFSGNLPQEYFQEWSAMKETQATADYMQTDISTVEVFDNQVMYIWDENYSYSMIMINKGVSLEYEKIINIFVAIDLSSNKFEGNIPESIKGLIGLQLLNLSNNELSGVIPSFIGKLTNLESLDFSSNKLSGMMPQELVQLKFLQVLNVSYNNLSGHIPQGKQFNTFPNNSYVGNSALCGDPLSKKCGKLETSNPSTVSSNEDTESDFPTGVDWVVILSGVGSGLVIGLVFGNHLTMRCYKWFPARLI